MSMPPPTPAAPPGPTLGPTCTVFYDGSCPLCSAEIGVYRRQDTQGSLTLVDVSQPSALPEGLTQAAALARFHVITADGQLLSGAAAFVAVWRGLAGWRWLARLSDLPGMLWLFEQGLPWIFADSPSLGPCFWPGVSSAISAAKFWVRPQRLMPTFPRLHLHRPKRLSDGFHPSDPTCDTSVPYAGSWRNARGGGAKNANKAG